jgi:hypothetical protein
VCDLLVAAASLQMPINPQVLNALMTQLVARGLNHTTPGRVVDALTALSVQGVALSEPFLNMVAHVSAPGHTFRAARPSTHPREGAGALRARRLA